MSSRIALWIVLLSGAALRLVQIEAKSLSHPEMWAPLIPLPWELADPGQRATLYEAVVHNLMADTHPPGYTIALWFWMKLAGDSVWALRLPSAACGIAAICLLASVARRGGSRAPWVAAALLAGNGYAAMWSATARMYAPATCAVVLATWLLLHLEERWRSWVAAVYSLVLLAALSLHVYGWVLAGVHLLWSGGRNRRAAWWQMLTMIVGSPLLAFAAYQSFHPVAELSRNPLPHVAALAGFGIALPAPALVDVFDPAGAPLPWNAAISALASLAGIALAMLGWRGARAHGTQATGAPSALWFVPAAAFACAITWIFVWRVANPHEGIRLVRAASITPWVMAAWWPLLSRSPLLIRMPLPLFSLTAPIAILSLATLAVPMITLRGLQIFAPFALLPIAEGILRISGHRGWAAALLTGVLGFASWTSVRGLAHRQVDPVDFREFSAEVAPRIEKGDAILWRRGWDSTPVLYYLRPTEHRYAPGCVAAVRFWELRLYGQPLPQGLAACVENRRAEKVVERPGAAAILWR